jgi:hypothetical protein
VKGSPASAARTRAPTLSDSQLAVVRSPSPRDSRRSGSHGAPGAPRRDRDHLRSGRGRTAPRSSTLIVLRVGIRTRSRLPLSPRGKAAFAPVDPVGVTALSPHPGSSRPGHAFGTRTWPRLRSSPRGKVPFAPVDPPWSYIYRFPPWVKCRPGLSFEVEGDSFEHANRPQGQNPDTTRLPSKFSGKCSLCPGRPVGLRCLRPSMGLSCRPGPSLEVEGDSFTPTAASLWSTPAAAHTSRTARRRPRPVPTAATRTGMSPSTRWRARAARERGSRPHRPGRRDRAPQPIVCGIDSSSKTSSRPGARRGAVSVCHSADSGS